MDPNESQANGEADEGQQCEVVDISPGVMATIVVTLALPVDIYVTHVRDAATGRAAFIFVAAICATIMYSWNLKRKWWFWAMIALMSAGEGYLLYRIPWYQGNLPPVSLLPVAIILTMLQLGCLALARRIFSRSGLTE